LNSDTGPAQVEAITRVNPRTNDKQPRKDYAKPRYSGQSHYSHSIVPGGFDVTSYTTRLTPFTSLMIRVAVSPRNFMSNW
jgi:hypothetical protein